MWRFGIAFLIMSTFTGLRLQGRAALQTLTKDQIFRLLMIGGVFVASALSTFISLKYISTTVYTVLLHLYPSFVVVILLGSGKKIYGEQWIAIAVGLSGVLLTIEADASVSSLFGILVGTINGLFFAIYIVLVASYGKEITGTVYISVTLLGMLTVIVLAVATLNEFIFPSAQGWFYLVILGVFSTILPALTMLLGSRRIGAANTSIVSATEPVVTMVLSYWLLSAAISLTQIAGVFLVVVSVIVLQIATLHRIR